jgi:tetratricopeptide (TPR) repeat protein
LLAYAERRYDEARRWFAAALTLFRQLSDMTGIGYALAGLGEVARTEGRYDEAADYYAENIALRRAQGTDLSAAICLANSGQVALARGQVSQARALLFESLTIYHRFGDQHGMAETLAGVAAVDAAMGAHVRAARWLAASQAWLQTLGAVLDPSDQLVFDQSVERVRAQLPAEVFGQTWADGAAAAESEAEQIALEVLEALGAARR